MPELRSGFLRVAPHTYVNVSRIRSVGPYYQADDQADPSACMVFLDDGHDCYVPGMTPEDVLAAIHEPEQPDPVVRIEAAHEAWNAAARALREQDKLRAERWAER